jgi:tetratricopeptide (TPR) repeat protein
MSEGQFGFLAPEEFNGLNEKYEAFKHGETHAVYFDVNELELLLDQYLEQNAFADVKNLIQIAEKLHPGSVGIKLRKAKYFFSDGKIRAAWNLLNQVQAIEPSQAEVYMLKGMIEVLNKKPVKAEDWFKTALAHAGDEALDMYYTIASTLESAHQYKAAAKYYELAYKHSENSDSELLYDLAYCHEKGGSVKKSLEFYHMYLDINPFSETAWYNMGVNYYNQEKYKKALEAFDYALTIDTEYLPAMQGKARVLIQNEDYNDGIKTYLKYIKNSQPDAEACFEIGDAYRHADRLEKAMTYYEMALDRDQTYADAHYGIALIKFEQETYMESLMHLRSAIRESAHNPDYWYTAGLASNKLGLHIEAEEAFEKALELYPYDPDFWLSYADLKYNNGKTDVAIDLLTRGATYNKNTATIKYRLAGYHLEQEDKFNAISCFAQAIELNREESGEFFREYPHAQYLDELHELLKKNR